MNFSIISNLVKKDAPLLASVISSTSPVAGIIVNVLMHAFGVTDGDSLSAALTNNPDASVKLKAIEDEHADNLSAIATNDRSNARAREIALAKVTGKRDWVISTIAIVYTLFFCTICVLVFFYEVKDDTLIVMLIGQISAGMGVVLNYFMGSSVK